MKPRVRKERFLEWYFSEQDDFIKIGKEVAEKLKKKGSYKMTVEKLFYKECTAIPAFITENETSEESMFLTSDCELVD